MARSRLGASLMSNLFRYLNLPQMLATVNTSLEKNLSLLLNIIWMLVCHPRVTNLIASCSNVVGVCSDMGTELGLADFEVPSVSCLLPHLPSYISLVPSDTYATGNDLPRPQHDTGLEADGDAGDATLESSSCGPSGRVFPKRLSCGWHIAHYPQYGLVCGCAS